MGRKRATTRVEAREGALGFAKRHSIENAFRRARKLSPGVVDDGEKNQGVEEQVGIPDAHSFHTYWAMAWQDLSVGVNLEGIH